MTQSLQDITFTADQLDKSILEMLDSFLGPKQYDEKQVPKWINQINQTLMAKLLDSQKPYKFLINTLIIQRKGANTLVTHNNFYDSQFDHSVVVSWPKINKQPEQIKQNLQCIVSVYALSTLNGLSYIKNQI